MVGVACRWLSVASFRCSPFVVRCWSLVVGGGCLFVSCCVWLCECFLKLLRLVVV